MNTPEAISRLQSNNADLVLIRLSGAVRIAMIPADAIPKHIDWSVDPEAALDAAIEKLKEGRGASMKPPLDEMDIECLSCEEDPEPDNPMDYDNYKCMKSKRSCGHHCNHSWSHEECCWCGSTFGTQEESPAEELGREIGH